ncbi:MAG: thymidine kinase [Parvularculaceae bacterium]
MAKLYFNYSAMNAGKSTALLQAAFNYSERGMRALMFTAAIDDRAGKGLIASRIGLKSEASLYDASVDLYKEIAREHAREPAACVFIDEAHMMERAHVYQLARAVDDLGIPVLCYGLRTNFRGELFDSIAALMALADEINELKTICECGAKATMNLRIDDAGRAVREGATIEIGGNDRYVPLCRRHFFERFGAGA